MDYMIEIGDGKGDLPPTPHNADDSLYESMLMIDVPEDAVNFSTKVFKDFLLSMTD